MRPLLPLLLALSTLPAMAGDRVTGKPFASRSEVIALHGMAATSQPLATNAALDILKAGGSAVDAAIAANAMLGLVEPTGNGIGGDLFAIIWDARTRRLYGLNASGRSPKSLSLEKLRELLKAQGLEHLPPHGPLPVSVPGAVDGWSELHAKFGRLPMKTLLAPAIRTAREGHPVSELIAYYWARSLPRLSKFPGFREQMSLAGQAPKKGEIWKNPNLANTLEAVAKGGRKAFYQGQIAHTIADYVQAQGGYLAYEDFASHRSEWVEPVSTSYRGYDVWELPPNSQGIAALQMLNLLEAYDLAKAGFGSPEHLHWFIEAKKIAFEDRAKFYADPAFNKLPVAELISKPYAEQRRKLLDPARAAKRIEAGNPALRQGDTIYLTTADAEGNMVSLIQSNYRGMGSGMTPPGLGFVLQDRGEMFSLEDGHANVYAPGKRPFQTIIPAFISKDGQPWVSFGVMGGDMQPQGHVQIVTNLIDFGMNLQEAGDAPRIYHTGSSEPTGELMTDGGVVNLESGFAAESVRSLLDKGHQLGWDLGGYGGYQAIQRDPKTGAYFGASESRKDGMAAGY
ncbi:MAG: gamma-glutamyltransferase [Nevskiaceae bacterium]|nr:MAG: gamma-glutamyltransferase [Nevskiaceae bacterium]TAM26133.1 MAG: gamma-glutamyltransferase [Nevskiaceae bacterium]